MFALLCIAFIILLIVPQPIGRLIMKLSNVFLIAALSVASLSSLSVVAKPGMSPERMLLSDRAKEYLSLTDAQQSQIKSIIEQQKSALEQYKEAGKETHLQHKALIHSETFDEQAFRDLLLSNQDRKIEVSVIKARGKNQIWNTLDEEQQAKLHKMMKHRKNKMRHGKKQKREEQ